MKKKLYYDLVKIVGKENIKVEEILKEHTFIKLGGKVDFYITPTTYKMVSKVVKLCNKYSFPLMVLGNGSNLIIRDGGIRGVIINLKNLDSVVIDDDTMFVEGGANTIEVSKEALENNLSGLEFACGIPGTIGGAIFMNAGAYGGQINDILIECLVVEKSGKIVMKNAKELEYDYRHSKLQENRDIVLAGKFKLEKSNYDKIKAVMDDLTYKRESKQPLEYPSCGSVFKRPKGYYAGKLIQDSDLQGYKIGGAEVSTKHAGFIVNKDNATANDYIKLIKHIQAVVKDKYNVELELEVKIVGEN